MIDAQRLLTDLKGLLSRLEDDLRERCEEHPEIDVNLKRQYEAARAANRTAQAYLSWRDDHLTQVGVAWILGCVFIRFLEDNGLLDEPLLSGPGKRRDFAMDARIHYFRQYPSHTDRHYLRQLFEKVGTLPAAESLFDKSTNPIWTMGPSADGAMALVEFWQAIDPDTGQLAHDFTDPEWNTRFLGDLYQDLSEATRKKFALLQTPEFVESFILDYTLTPAIRTFGFHQLRLIDPTCGSGHFLLGAFHRLFDLWMQHEPGTVCRAQAQRALDGVYGVDINPYAVAIARFRLLLAAMKVCGETQLAQAPGFRINLAVGDSLLFNLAYRGASGLQMTFDPDEDPLRHCYETEDRDLLMRVLGQTYHAVVGNPPYITVKDEALNQAYRDRYATCHRSYSMAVPFTERFFHLAQPQSTTTDAGFVGMITANSFMKREFGKKLIEEFFTGRQLTHVIDTSGAYIPGHGTPTVILFGRNRCPDGASVRAVLGIRGEPATPKDAAQGKVWRSIVDLIDTPGSENDFVSVDDKETEVFHHHPWSLGGGGAAELKDALEKRAVTHLKDCCAEIGFGVVTREDEAYLISRSVGKRQGVSEQQLMPLVSGEVIRDWSIIDPVEAIWPYDRKSLEPTGSDRMLRYLWRHRAGLSRRVAYGLTQIERGLEWFEYSMFFKKRFRTPLSIAFAFVATHNHFVLDRGGKVFNRSAPVIKLPPEASEDDHLALLGLLNSSTACFWMKQVFHNKGSTVDEKGARQTTVDFENFYEHTGTGLQQFPICSQKPLTLSREIESTAEKLLESSPGTLPNPSEADPDPFFSMRRQMIALQEELDWFCYNAYGFIDEDLCYHGDDLPPLELGQRAFEIHMARRITDGSLETTWFDRHRSKPITELPENWPREYADLVKRRMQKIDTHRNIRLIEKPEFKRRWQVEPWESQVHRACEQWLLERLESLPIWQQTQLVSTRRLADALDGDSKFGEVAAIYRGRPDFDLQALVTELVLSDAVPLLPVLRYKPSGLRKREQWEHTWDLQRQEDAIDARMALPESDQNHLSAKAAEKLKTTEIGEIPVPPKYSSGDFLKPTYWKRRGKLDVPKERFILFPFCEPDGDPSPVIGWAGWDHLQQAQAIAEYTIDVKQNEGWSPERLIPLLGCILELLPWLKQWHHEFDPTAGMGMGDYFENFLDTELHSLEQTRETLIHWKPPKVRKTRKKKKKKT